MNERIQEIALQATETFTTYFDGRGNVTETYFDKEKFAELIVRECIDIIEKLPPGYKDYRDQIEDAFRIASIVEIKQRFGVK